MIIVLYCQDLLLNEATEYQTPDFLRRCLMKEGRDFLYSRDGIKIPPTYLDRRINKLRSVINSMSED